MILARLLNYEPRLIKIVCGMSFSDSTALRHMPRQVRGQRKVDHIIRSAEALFAEVGFDQATTNAIAARAGVSIGSLYQFFASKEAILAAMADRYLEQTRVAMSKALESAHETRLDDLLTSLLETLVKLQEQRPYFLQCLGRSRPSPVLSKAVMELNDSVTNQLRAVLERATTESDRGLLHLRARICVETMGALLPLAVRAKGRERTLAIGEIVSVLTHYLGPTLKVQGVV
jgi:AcrR family transcriptional regulator